MKPSIKIPIDEFEKALLNSSMMNTYSQPTQLQRATTFSSMISNESVLSIQECAVHAKPLEIRCLSCAQDICVDCALFFDHRGHKIERHDHNRSNSGKPELIVQDFRQKAEKLLEDSKKIAQAFSTEMTNRKTRTHEAVDSGFNDLKSELEKSRACALASVAAHYQNLRISFQGYQESIVEKIEGFLLTLNKKNKSKETLIKEFSQLEKMMQTKTLTDPFSHTSVSVSFNIDWGADIKNFCMVGRVSKTGMRTSALKLGEEDNLLQESFTDSVFKDITETNTALDEKMSEPIYLSQRSLARPAKSGSFAPGQFVKSSHPSEYKMSFCVTPTHMLLQKNKSVFKFDEELWTKKPNRNPMMASINRFSITPKAEINSWGLDSAQGSRPSQAMTPKQKLDHIKTDRPIRTKTENSPFKRENSRSITSKPNDPRVSYASLHPQSTRNASKFSAINLANLGMDDFTTEAYFSKIDINPMIKTLTLSGNQLTDRGLKMVLKSITPYQIDTLFIANNYLRDRSLDYLMSFAKYNSYLKSVFLQENRIDGKSAEIKAKIVKLKKSGIQVFL
jgi:hypothetical protein